MAPYQAQESQNTLYFKPPKGLLAGRLFEITVGERAFSVPRQGGTELQHEWQDRAALFYTELSVKKLLSISELDAADPKSDTRQVIMPDSKGYTFEYVAKYIVKRRMDCLPTEIGGVSKSIDDFIAE